MFLLKHDLPFVEDKYETPTFLLKNRYNYAPFLLLTNNVDYLQQIDLVVQDIITILYTILTPMEEVEKAIKESIEEQLLFLRQNYPLKYTNYAKSCTTIATLLFSNDSVEFEDAQLSNVYNEFLNGERLTLKAQILILNLNTFLNKQISLVNIKINFLNTYGDASISNLDLVTNYREQNYITIVNDKIDEINTFFNTYYQINYVNKQNNIT